MYVAAIQRAGGTTPANVTSARVAFRHLFALQQIWQVLNATVKFSKSILCLLIDLLNIAARVACATRHRLPV